MARKFSAAQLRAQRAFAAKYGGKKSSKGKRSSTGGRVKRARTVNPVAKKSPGRVRRAASRVGQRVNKNAVLSGALAGAGAPIADQVVPGYGAPIAMGVAGILTGDATMQANAAFAATSRIVGGALSSTGIAAPRPAGGYL